jgi:hypothetical protein
MAKAGSYTPSQHAVRALRNGRGRALKHAENGDMTRANLALWRGILTAELWLTGNHPKFAEAKVG